MDNALNEFANDNPGAKQFVERYELASADKETRTTYRKWEYEQALHIMELQMRWAEGREEGKAEGMIEAAKKLIKINCPINEIADVTGLTHAEIEQLRKDLGD